MPTTQRTKPTWFVYSRIQAPTNAKATSARTWRDHPGTEWALRLEQSAALTSLNSLFENWIKETKVPKTTKNPITNTPTLWNTLHRQAQAPSIASTNAWRPKTIIHSGNPPMQDQDNERRDWREEQWRHINYLNTSAPTVLLLFYLQNKQKNFTIGHELATAIANTPQPTGFQIDA